MFPRSAMNALFQNEIRKVLPSVGEGIQRDDLIALLDYDFVGYIDASLRNAGFDEAERDPLVHDLVVKLLISPGGLVSRWKMDNLLSHRFKRSIKNAVITLSQKQARRRKRMRELPDDQVAREQPRDQDELVRDFREWLRLRHGEPAVRVFNARLEDRDIKDLIGREGIPTAYALKRIVSQIKAAAVLWAGTDPAFQERIRWMMDAESKTLAKRFKKAVPQDA